MEVVISEAPGGAGEIAQCPTCSKAYPLRDESGPLAPPRKCRRCESPMDLKQSVAFRNSWFERDKAPSIERERETRTF